MKKEAERDLETRGHEGGLRYMKGIKKTGMGGDVKNVTEKVNRGV